MYKCHPSVLLYFLLSTPEPCCLFWYHFQQHHRTWSGLVWSSFMACAKIISIVLPNSLNVLIVHLLVAQLLELKTNKQTKNNWVTLSLNMLLRCFGTWRPILYMHDSSCADSAVLFYDTMILSFKWQFSKEDMYILYLFVLIVNTLHNYLGFISLFVCYFARFFFYSNCLNRSLCSSEFACYNICRTDFSAVVLYLFVPLFKWSSSSRNGPINWSVWLNNGNGRVLTELGIDFTLFFIGSLITSR